ncbi:MAG: hypothetical protein A2150_08115 [Candidatus Muproteobacteria bacterium RBG_16_64_11]|uniref:Uncharacterized protein n=1 Tax=Candidatus Muproteobacteria bacterium RBG_16_64_11 TaxID=1817758 RepID=A0A1F6TB52_9PROT|nr:MAG: hypothetical protein A2150_08115 [Candidatus Muproteobacteria bacterium RBG_16_64_11]
MVPYVVLSYGPGTGMPQSSAGLTAIWKASLAPTPDSSVAVSTMLRLPMSPEPGVPLKVRVAELKLSQVGSAEPSASSAL